MISMHLFMHVHQNRYAAISLAVDGGRLEQYRVHVGAAQKLIGPAERVGLGDQGQVPGGGGGVHGFLAHNWPAQIDQSLSVILLRHWINDRT